MSTPDHTFTCLTNRLWEQTTDGTSWMHVCPLGEFPWTSADGKETLIQVIDEEAIRLMANSYPLNVQDSLIDWEHKSMGSTEDTDAAGWGKGAEARATGVYVNVDWSDTGKTAVQGKRYKFCSPCFPRSGLVHLGGNRYRPTQISRIALTNNPNLRGLDPLTNRRTEEAANPNPNEPKTHMDYKAKLLEILGLPAGASDEEIATGCAALGAKPKDQMATLNRRVADLEGQLAATILDAHGIKDEKQRQLFTPLLTNSSTKADAEATLQQLKGAAAKAPSTLHNRHQLPTPKTVEQLSQAEVDADQAATALHNRATAYAHKNRVTYETALAAVRRLPAEG